MVALIVYNLCFNNAASIGTDVGMTFGLQNLGNVTPVSENGGLVANTKIRNQN